MKYTEVAAQATPCGQCGAEIPSRLLVCPSCGGLVHSGRLKDLAASAATAQQSGDAVAEIGHWREMLSLLPEGSQQYAHVNSRVQELTRFLDSGKAPVPRTVSPPPPPPPIPTVPEVPGSDGKMKKLGAGLAVLGAILVKFKDVLIILLTKGKLLLFGLSKTSTLFSIFASFGLYWSLWGWKFAGGLILGIYIHELGHVAALRKFGVKTSTMMFVPGLGAYVRHSQHPGDALEDSRVGLAGPFWGLAASAIFYIIYLIGHAPIWAAVSHINTWINLMNLVPVMPLDGGRGVRVLAGWQRWILAAGFGLAAAVTRDGLLVILTLIAVFIAFKKGGITKGDNKTLIQFLLLIAALSALLFVKIPQPAFP